MLLPGAAADEDELSVGNSSGQIRRFLNIGTAASPSWQDGGLLQTPGGSTVDVGSYANPILFDLVTDGPVHLMVGDSDGRLDIVTEQTGGWAQTLSGYNAFDVGTYSSPALADLDSDADLDLLIGNSSGQLYLRSNLGTATSVAWFLAERLVDPTGAVIDIGSRAAPTLVDLDDDGDLDIVVGNSSGRLFLVRNDGDAATPSWAAGAQINYGNGSVIDVGSYAAPVAGDFDSDGDMDLLVGNSGGLVRYLRNDGDEQRPELGIRGKSRPRLRRHARCGQLCVSGGLRPRPQRDLGPAGRQLRWTDAPFRQPRAVRFQSGRRRRSARRDRCRQLCGTRVRRHRQRR